MHLKTVTTLILPFLFACSGVDDAPELPEGTHDNLAVEDAEGTIDPAEIQAAMRSDFAPAAQACYEAVLTEDATAAGKVVMRFVIIDGVATEPQLELAEGNLDGATFTQCMTDAMADVSLPRADGKVTVNYPFVFSSD